MTINVPDWAVAHFWEEPPEGSEEFWGFRWPPRCKPGDTIWFRIGGEYAAKAIISRIEPPGQSACEGTGRFRSCWKVFWSPESFQDIRTSTATLPF